MSPWQTNPGFNNFQNVKIVGQKGRDDPLPPPKPKREMEKERIKKEKEVEELIEKPQKPSKIPLIIIAVALCIIACLVKTMLS